jgi:predicted HTH domain antitoxin
MMPESKSKEGIEMSTKTLSIRVDDEDYRFLSALAKEEKEDVSKKVRELVDLGRVMLALEKYKKSEASIEKSARIAGVSISKMIDILREHGVEPNLEYEDYLKGLKSVRKVW